jgi:hypothetical protein
VQRGESLPRFEYKRAYNGAEGVPIREEILERHGETIITRNGYGARCLNTPNVLFADLDVETGGVRGWLRDTFGRLLTLVAPAIAEDPWVAAERRVREYATAHPQCLLRLYRTPAGFRVLALHRTFVTDDPEVAALFTALAVDPVYVRMCTRQRCFRARVSPKPWRVGATWPVKSEQMGQRERWVKAYESASRGHAACQFVAQLGAGREDPAAAAVRALHDAICQAERDLPLA